MKLFALIRRNIIIFAEDKLAALLSLCIIKQKTSRR